MRLTQLCFCCPRGVLDKHLDSQENTFSTSSLCQKEGIFTIQNICPKEKIYKICQKMLDICPHLHIHNHRERFTRECFKTLKPQTLQVCSTKLPLSPVLKFLSQRVKFIMLLHRNKQTTSMKHITRKRKGIQLTPLILKLVNHYLGVISYVFCASWLASK